MKNGRLHVTTQVLRNKKYALHGTGVHSTRKFPEDLFHDGHLELQERMRNPIAFHAEMMGDIMYLQQALKQHEAKLFVDAIIKEINGHVENKNWDLVHRDTVPQDAQVVPSVWAMQRKRDLTTNKVRSHKA